MKPYVWQGRPEPPKPRPYTKVRCGTISGYTFHYRAGDKPCPACRKAYAAYNLPRQKLRRTKQKQQQLTNASPGTRRLLEAVANAYRT